LKNGVPVQTGTHESLKGGDRREKIMEEATPNLFSLIRHWLQQATTSIVYTMFPNVLNHSQLLAESLNNFTRIMKTLVPSRNKAEFCRESALVSWTNLVAFSY